MILVTGGTGLTGSQLIFDLVSSGKKVRALYRKNSNKHVTERTFAANKDLYNKIEWVEGDVTDIFSIDDAMQGVDTVYHTAAFISFDPSDRKKMLKVNSEGTANMINMSLKNNIQRFCYVSSVATLGRISEDAVIDENSWWKTSKNNSNYAISKYGGEREVWRGMEEGLSAFIINPTIIIGPGTWKSGSTQMFSQVWKGLSFYVPGSTGFVDVRDVSRAAIQLMDKGVSNERYIINSENTTYRRVFDLIAENLGKKKPSIPVIPLMGAIGWRFEKLKKILTGIKPMLTSETIKSGFMNWKFSNQKIKQITGIEFISVEQSVKDTARVFLSDVGG